VQIGVMRVSAWPTEFVYAAPESVIGSIRLTLRVAALSANRANTLELREVDREPGNPVRRELTQVGWIITGGR
jgi:hypothetical protein